MDQSEIFKKELEKLMPIFNKPKSNTFVGLLAWLFIALFACIGSWVIGVMIGLGMSGCHFITRLLG